MIFMIQPTADHTPSHFSHAVIIHEHRQVWVGAGIFNGKYGGSAGIARVLAIVWVGVVVSDLLTWSLGALARRGVLRSLKERLFRWVLPSNGPMQTSKCNHHASSGCCHRCMNDVYMAKPSRCITWSRQPVRNPLRLSLSAPHTSLAPASAGILQRSKGLSASSRGTASG